LFGEATENPRRFTYIDSTISGIRGTSPRTIAAKNKNQQEKIRGLGLQERDVLRYYRGKQKAIFGRFKGRASCKKRNQISA